MKSILKFCFIALTLLVLFPSCRKKPKADFLLKQYEYAAGDAISYDNLSEDSPVCKWEIMDSDSAVIQTDEGCHANIITHLLLKDGPYSLRLTTYNKKGKRESSVKRNFLVKSTKNYLRINVYSSGDQEVFDVYIDNQYIGKSYYGEFQKQIPIGYRYIKLVAPNETLEGLYNLNNDVNISF